MSHTAPSPHGGFSPQFEWAGYALGFGIGGFFDGILLHQILQWHHLLSGIDQTRLDIRVLVLWDGIFHALMYVIAGVGLWLLWRARKEFPAPHADRRLFANALIGFGAWHIADSILSHWLLGIHRIRMDVENPLFWDILWFGAFGVIPAASGLMMRRGGSSGKGRSLSSPFALMLAVAITGPIAALPPADQTQVVVLFRPGITEEAAIAAIAAVDGRIISSDASGQLWAVYMSPGGNARGLYRHGALLVSQGLLPIGCFNWTRA